MANVNELVLDRFPHNSLRTEDPDKCWYWQALWSSNSAPNSKYGFSVESVMTIIDQMYLNVEMPSPPFMDILTFIIFFVLR